MKKTILLFLLCSGSIFAQDAETKPSKPSPTPKKIAIILKIGTTGISPEVSYHFKPKINFRGVVSFYSYHRNDIVSFDQGDDVEKGKVQYDAKLKVGNVGALVDYYPFKKFLAINAGVFYNLTAVDVGIVPKSNIKFNDRIFTPEETGTLGLKMKYNKVAPYLGLSFGNPHNGKVKFLFDLGVLYSGSPKIEMQGTGSIEPTAAQAPQLEANLKPVYLYPVMKFGLSYAIK
ncbi:hypothetical protein [Emticicia sp. SJ17W-69]|uniref:hypothetical protein n=1 Tax=Emticicia sp. SJ17W-69 TaxID=3421657 RepID=UPI003EBB187F